MNLTEKELTTMCEKICKKIDYPLTIPVKINKRLTRTLGRFTYQQSYDTITSKLIEISNNFLKTATLEDIEAVLAHECAHYLVVEETHEKHGHDAVFKEMCKRLGTTNDKTVYAGQTSLSPESYKYSVYCNECGSPLGGYHRAGKIVKNPSLGYCKHCGGTIKIVQNW